VNRLRPSNILCSLLIGLFALVHLICRCDHAEAAGVTSQPAAAHDCCDEAGSKSKQSRSAGGHSDTCPHCAGATFVKPATTETAVPIVFQFPLTPSLPVVIISTACLFARKLQSHPPALDHPPQTVPHLRTIKLLV
jgi:hypothetical protein